MLYPILFIFKQVKLGVLYSNLSRIVMFLRLLNPISIIIFILFMKARSSKIQFIAIVFHSIYLTSQLIFNN